MVSSPKSQKRFDAPTLARDGGRRVEDTTTPARPEIAKSRPWKPTPLRHALLNARGGTPLLLGDHLAADIKRSDLFGKIAGIFWWDQHARGSADCGIVKSTHVIETN